MKAMIKLGDILSLIGPQQHIRICEEVKGKEIELFVGKAASLRMSNEQEHKDLLDRYAKLMLIAANLNEAVSKGDKAAETDGNSKKEPPFSLKIYIL
ncbi:MAG: hypothetical protein E7263_06030 [Lachnospiraceae bacterium]|nr:hypothetical protein [Lachnospiraceae bacterium]